MTSITSRASCDTKKLRTEGQADGLCDSWSRIVCSDAAALLTLLGSNLLFFSNAELALPWLVLLFLRQLCFWFSELLVKLYHIFHLSTAQSITLLCNSWILWRKQRLPHLEIAFVAHQIVVQNSDGEVRRSM